MEFRTSLRLAIVAGAFAVSGSAQDVTITYKVSGAKSAATTSKWYMTSERLRTSEPQSDIIVEFGPGRLVQIDHQKKQFSETTFAEMQAQLKALTAKLDEQFAAMPPAMREKMAGMLGGAAATATVTKGGPTRKVAGYECTPYKITIGDSMTIDSCNSTSVPVPAPALSARKDLFAAVNAANPAMRTSLAKIAEQMEQVKGIPLQETTVMKMMGRSMETAREATSVETGPIPASAFDVPAGYKKVPSPLSQAAGK